MAVQASPTDAVDENKCRLSPLVDTVCPGGDMLAAMRGKNTAPAPASNTRRIVHRSMV